MSLNGQCIQGLAYVPGQARGQLSHDTSASDADTILVLHQDQLAGLTAGATGVIVIAGAPLSHAMIRLLGLGLPAVSIDAELADILQPGTEVLLDGSHGIVTIAPDGEHADLLPPAAPKPGQPVHSSDGIPVQLFASVRDAGAATHSVASGATAIGLVRSEFFQPDDGRTPDQAWYLAQFRALCEASQPLPVTFRLLDISPDKRPAWLPATAGTSATLGLHGARLFSTGPVHDVVEAQLQAIGVLAGEYPLRVILPYLTRHEELAHWAGWARHFLPPSVALGAMIETPASALDLGRWFDRADFLAVGCNDLMQCLFAADRDRAELAAYLDPYAPQLYRLLRQMAEAAGDQLDQVQLCGVLPQLQGVLPILLGLGYRAFSVDPVHIPYLARTISQLRVRDAQQLARQICQARHGSEVMALLGLPLMPYQPFVC
jgi:phosphoenolpyruvate-protein kinase (PTS system EI component)